MKKIIIAAILLSAAPIIASAESFTFSETINGNQIFGTFVGTVNNNDSNIIDNITSLTLNDPNLSIFQSTLTLITLYSNETCTPHLSLNGLDNNIFIASTDQTYFFLSIDTPYLLNPFQAVQYNKNPPLITTYQYAFNNTTNWAAQAVNAPEPGILAMMLLGLPFFVSVARRRKA